MADEHYRWLDRDTAERVLRGEPLEAVGDDDARRAGRLTGTLDALSAVPSGPGGELPGEEAALTAFREARAESAMDAAVTSVGSPATAAGRAGRHRAGAAVRPAGNRRWGRPVRFGLAAAFAACMVGGVAVAAGTGVLPSPFGDRGNPVPASSVSAAHSDRPLSTGSPSPTGGGDKTLPDGSANPDRPSTGPDRKEPAPKDKGTSPTPKPGPTENGRAAEALRRELTKGCVKYRAGRLTATEKQRLRDSAERYGRGPADIARICDRVLADADDHTSGADGQDGGPDGDEDSGSNGPGNGYGFGNGPGNNTHTNSVGSGDDDIRFHTVTPGTSPNPSYSAAPQLPTAAPSPSAS
ncbi:extensin [Streptomyces sp. NPDC057694]|uniref:extensin n=1 Tax=Streptomyces sp. NPDC057694 TaxID=3346216 RepID=UPI00367C6214